MLLSLKLHSAAARPGVMCFATKMQAGVTKSTKDSESKRLGIKKFGGEWVGHNKILVRQRGFKWRPGANVHVGRDHTIHSACEGYVYHYWDAMLHRTIINVVPSPAPVKRHLPSRVFCFHPELYPDRALNNPAPTNYPVHVRKSRTKEKKPVYYGIPLQDVAYREVKAEVKAEEVQEVQEEQKSGEEVKASS